MPCVFILMICLAVPLPAGDRGKNGSGFKGNAEIKAQFAECDSLLNEAQRSSAGVPGAAGYVNQARQIFNQAKSDYYRWYNSAAWQNPASVQGQLQTIDPFGDYLFHGVPLRPADGKLVTRHFDPDGLAARAEEWSKQMKQIIGKVDTMRSGDQAGLGREVENMLAALSGNTAKQGIEPVGGKGTLGDQAKSQIAALSGAKKSEDGIVVTPGSKLVNPFADNPGADGEPLLPGTTPIVKTVDSTQYVIPLNTGKLTGYGKLEEVNLSETAISKEQCDSAQLHIEKLQKRIDAANEALGKLKDIDLQNNDQLKEWEAIYKREVQDGALADFLSAIPADKIIEGLKLKDQTAETLNVAYNTLQSVVNSVGSIRSAQGEDKKMMVDAIAGVQSALAEVMKRGLDDHQKAGVDVISKTVIATEKLLTGDYNNFDQTIESLVDAGSVYAPIGVGQGLFKLGGRVYKAQIINGTLSVLGETARQTWDGQKHIQELLKQLEWQNEGWKELIRQYNATHK